jgi:F-type H+-transporting ATPase subunit b
MKLIRILFLATLVIACSFLMAQEQATPSSPPPGEQKATETTGSHPDHAIRDAQRELAHRANEAAGREVHGEGSQEGEADEGHAEFKHSPSVKWFASHTGLSVSAAYWVLVGLNFAIIAVFVIWALKKNLPSAFRARTANIRKNLDEARRASEDANRRLSDIEGRLSRLDAEIAEMKKNAETETAAEEERIKVAAEQERRNIVASAEQDIEAAVKSARRELKVYTASLAVSLAEKKIIVDSRTDEALVGRFVRELGSAGKDGR